MAITKATASSIAPAAKGDLVAGSATNDAAVLTVGANNTVLTADSAEATGLKWAAASSGALTKITSASFTTQSSVAIDNIFTSSYTKYLIVFGITGSTDCNLYTQYRYAGPTTQTADYYGGAFKYSKTNTLSTFGFENASQNTITNAMGSTAYNGVYGEIWLSNMNNSAKAAVYHGQAIEGSNQAIVNYAGYNNTLRTYTGFLFAPSSGTITGDYAVYGVSYQ